MSSQFSYIHTKWRRLAVKVLISCLLLISHLTRARARIHWIGGHGRPRRPERALMCLLIFGGMLTFETHELMTWSIMMGGGLAIFLNLYTVYRFVPRKQNN
jgi:hypothetical protein